MNSEYIEMIKDCENRESRMSEWETNFVADMADRLGDGKSLTPRQAEKLEEVWDRATNRG